jgi:4'-phosphopantetheinyl transferase
VKVPGLDIGTAEVHVWWARLDLEPELLREMQALLSARERARALSFRLERDGDRFTAAAGWRRRLLAAYLDADPRSLEFAEGPFGKPELAGPANGWLRFNVSHSTGLGLYAVARGRDLGVDVEHVCPDLEVDQLARRVLTGVERAQLARHPWTARPRALLEYWVSKEAFLKALGQGLSVPLDAVEATARPDRSLEVTCLRPLAGHERRQFSVHAIDAGPDWVAAVAVEGDGADVPFVASPITTVAHDDSRGPLFPHPDVGGAIYSAAPSRGRTPVHRCDVLG